MLLGSSALAACKDPQLFYAAAYVFCVNSVVALPRDKQRRALSSAKLDSRKEHPWLS
jgi:hypothetical protein